MARSNILAALTHRQQCVVGQAEHPIDTFKLYAELRDLVAEAGAVDTMIGRPEVLRSRLADLCDRVGRCTNPRLPPVAAPPAQPQSEPVTDAMVSAYLEANDAYWREVDALPTDITKPWRQGTPREATRVSLAAALAAQPPERAAQQRADYVPMPTSADEAAMMCLIGEAWLRENAPERLRAAQQEPDSKSRVKRIATQMGWTPPAAQQEAQEAATGPVAHLRSITHPDWLELCEPGADGAFPVYATPPLAMEPTQALTHEQIASVIEKHAGSAEWSDDEFASASALIRAYEAARGIGKQGKDNV